MRQITILATLLVAALVGSYLEWTKGSTDHAKDEQVMVYRASPDDLVSVDYKQPDNDVLLEQKSDAKGKYVWVTITEQVEPPATDDKGADDEGADAPPAPAPKTQTVSFKGNDAAEKAWKDFAPLYALRELKPDPAVGDAAFGFDKPTGHISVKKHDAQIDLVMGGQTYGARDKYVKYDKRIFLLDDKTLRPLQYAKTRLVDRVLQPIAESKTDTVEVTWKGQKATFVQKNKDDRSAAFWARSDKPTEAAPDVGTWLGKVMRMRIQDYDVPADAASLQPVFSFVVSDGKDSWSVDVLKSGGGNPEYYARSEYSRGVVHLTESLATEAVADLSSMFPNK